MSDPAFLSADYWSKRYADGTDAWNVGSATTPLKAYIDQLQRQDLKILIPGCGNAHEAVYLIQKGFKQVTCLDISSLAVQRLTQHLQLLHLNCEVVCADFFAHTKRYDLVLEQTFFCALHPDLRQAYVKQMYELLAPAGKLAGVLFDCTFEHEGPPFGGNAALYRELFEPFFHMHTLEPCYNSIAARSGRELFVILERKAS